MTTWRATPPAPNASTLPRSPEPPPSGASGNTAGPAWREGAAPEYLVHGHCHQKAFGAFDDTLALLRGVPGARVTAVESSCCGMAGSFGHEHYDVSMAMGEASLLPAVRAASPQATVVAAGTSCRHQIGHGASRQAVHPAVALAAELAQ